MRLGSKFGWTQLVGDFLPCDRVFESALDFCLFDFLDSALMTELYTLLQATWY